MGSSLVTGEIDNVLIVVADSLRADTARTDMATVQSLADEHARFSTCFSVGPHTPSSMSGVVQSRLPTDGGYGTDLPSERPTIAEALSADNVRCAGWHCNPHTTAERGFDRGYDSYRDLLQDSGGSQSTGGDTGATKATLKTHIKRAADTLGVRRVVDNVADILKEQGLLTVDPRVPAETFVNSYTSWVSETEAAERFASLHFMDTHMPYEPPGDHWSRSRFDAISSRRAHRLYRRLMDPDRDLTDEELGDLKTLYRAEAEYVDSQLKRIISFLKTNSLWESTLLLFTSDHGELFGERTAPDGSTTGHPSYLCSEVAHVPLVVAGGPVPDIERESLVSGLDIGPTVARALDVESPDVWQGRPLGEADRETVVSSVATPPGERADTMDPESVHVAARSEECAVLWWNSDYGPEYYDRSTPEERVSNTEDDSIATLESVAEQRGTLSAESFATDELETISEERLQNLGYME